MRRACHPASSLSMPRPRAAAPAVEYDSLRKRAWLRWRVADGLHGSWLSCGSRRMAHGTRCDSSRDRRHLLDDHAVQLVAQECVRYAVGLLLASRR